MFLLVFWILFWEPWWSRFVGIRGVPRLTEACPRHAWQPQGCCACVGQAVVCRVSPLHLSLLRQKAKKMPIEEYIWLPPRVLLGSCAPSSAVSVAGGWWVAAVGFVVVLQRYRLCGSWACPGGLVSGWTWCLVRIGGYLVGWIWSLKTGEGFSRLLAGRKFYYVAGEMPPTSKLQILLSGTKCH